MGWSAVPVRAKTFEFPGKCRLDQVNHRPRSPSDKSVGAAASPCADQSFGPLAGFDQLTVIFSFIEAIAFRFQQFPVRSYQGKQVADRIRAMPTAIHPDCKPVAPVDGRVIPGLCCG